MEAYAYGDITLYDVTADANGIEWWDPAYYVYADGAYLDNSSGTGSVTVDNSDITGDGFNDNGGNGLLAVSNGAISLTSVTANNNGSLSFWSNGAYLDNSQGSGKIEVDLSFFNGNVGYFGNGLYALSAGEIKLTSVTADSNSNLSDGVYLDNTAGSGNIEVDNTLGGEFNLDNANGLEAYSDGSVTLTNVTADTNNWDGAALGDPNYSPYEIGGTVTVNGGDFSHNFGNGDDPSTYVECSGPCTPDPAGLEAYADGGISLSGVTANSNTGGDGVYLDNTTGTGTSNITLIDVTADNNGGNGADLETLGSISVDPSSFNDNGGDGLFINTPGHATVICSAANGNSGYGVDGTMGGVFTDGLTTAGNTLGSNNITGYSSLVNSVCNPGGSGASGTTTSAGGPGPLPWNVVNVSESGSQGSIIPVTGGTGVALDCTHYSGTDLVLANGDHVLLPCPIGSTPGTNGSLRGLISGSLPGKLDSKYTFVSAFDAEVTPSLTGGMMTVSFTIPSGKQGSNFAIMHWDGSKWVSLGGSATPPGFFSVSTNLTGDFVLVTQ